MIKIIKMTITTNYKSNTNVDLGVSLITKKYFLDVYESLLPSYKAPIILSSGYNSVGQLGDATTITRSSPVQLSGSAAWKKISVGSTTSHGIKTDGTLWTWGADSFGSSGLNSISGLNRNSPVQIGSEKNWDNIANGEEFSLAIKSDGTLWSWGINLSGNLGDGAIDNKSSPTQIGSNTSWKIIATGKRPERGPTFEGDRHCAAIKMDGTLWTWGNNSKGQLGLGLGSGTSTSSPTQVGSNTNWSSVSCGEGNTLAIKNDGTLWGWGWDEHGKNAGAGQNSPTQIGSNTNWKQVSAGCMHTLAIKNDDSLWVWGMNVHGCLGVENIISRSSPIQMGLDYNWYQVSTGNNFSIAVRTNGTMWSWGFNTDGELGLNDRLSKSSPVQVISGSNNWISVSTSSGANNYFIAIKDNYRNNFGNFIY